MTEKQLTALRTAALRHGELTDDRGWAGISEVEASEGVPAHIRIAIIQKPGKRSYIHTEIHLPKKWNGKLLGIGIGGIGGYIPEDELNRGAARGYATAASDLGTYFARNGGKANSDTYKDFGWRANHVMTLAAKDLIFAYYGRHESYAFFQGGSTGGQQALSLAQRFPYDYQGIIAGVPAHDRLALHTYFLWNYNHLRTSTGKPLFTREEIEKITDLGVAFMQSKGDGEKGDNFVSLPPTDNRTITAFCRYLEENMPLTRPQIAAAKAVYEGPRNPRTGKPIFGGMPIGSEVYFCGFGIGEESEPPHVYPFRWAFGQDFVPDEFDFDEDYATLRRKLSKDLDANDPRLDEFKNAGGKLLIYSGAADSCVVFHSTVKYLKEVVARFGKEETDSFVRYFFLPGKGHSIEGRGTNRWRSGIANGKPCVGLDELDMLRIWVENGQAPDAMTASRVEDEKTVFGRLCYAYDFTS